MRVPINADVFDTLTGPIDCDQWHARLDQSPGLQHALPVRMPAVAIADRRRLGVKVEGVAAGADVSLVSDCSSEGIRVRPIPRVGALSLIRALDAEEQLRTLDAVIAFDSRTHLLLRCVPSK